MRRIIISTSLIVFFIILGSIVAILYASGYRFNFGAKNGKFVEGTGMIVLSSTPEGAKVSINNHLTTATNNTINLPPGDYTVKIEKDGYFPWSKKITVKEKEVSQANATLFPNTPKLEPLTNTGINTVAMDESNSLIAYTVASSSARKNGVYLLDMSAHPILPIGGLATQLTDDVIANFSNASLSFSPDGDQILAEIATSPNFPSYYLLSTRSFNNSPQDVTATLAQVQQDWKRAEDLKQLRTINSLPLKLRPVALQYFGNMVISPLEDKVLYTASASGNLQSVLTTPLKGVNSTPENRQLEKGNIYVYDIKEDRNYLIYDASKNQEQSVPQFIWHPDSNHLAYIKDNLVNIMEFDGQNNTTLYAGPFNHGFLSIWPDGSQLIILTNLNIPGAAPNLYRLSLR